MANVNRGTRVHCDYKAPNKKYIEGMIFVVVAVFLDPETDQPMFLVVRKDGKATGAIQTLRATALVLDNDEAPVKLANEGDKGLPDPKNYVVRGDPDHFGYLEPAGEARGAAYARKKATPVSDCVLKDGWDLEVEFLVE